MLFDLWSGKNPLYRLLLPLSALYGLVVKTRRYLYKQQILDSYKAPVPVVIVGNLTAGGNGKTPFVIWLVEQMKKQGVKVGVVSRGYGSKSKRFPIIIDEQVPADMGGDEPVLIYRRTNVPIVIDPKRSRAVKTLLKNFNVDLIISDDGLQHYALQRNIEIVLVDGQRLFGNGYYFPAGPLRERVSRLEHVDVIVMNGIMENNTVIPKSSAPIINMSYCSKALINIKTGQRIAIPQHKNVIALAGIGYPDRFFNLLTQVGLLVNDQHAFSDHHNYTKQELEKLNKADQMLIMTEKDAVKCQAFAKSNWWFLPIDADIAYDQGEFVINMILPLITNKKET